MLRWSSFRRSKEAPYSQLSNIVNDEEEMPLEIAEAWGRPVVGAPRTITPISQQNDTEAFLEDPLARKKATDRITPRSGVFFTVVLLVVLSCIVLFLFQQRAYSVKDSGGNISPVISSSSSHGADQNAEINSYETVFLINNLTPFVDPLPIPTTIFGRR